MKPLALVTGAQGFIGTHLCKKLVKENYPFETFNGDVTNFSAIFEKIKTKEFSIIYHLAAISSTGQCEQYPDKAFQVNVGGTFNLLEAIKRKGTPVRLIFPSTSHVYAALDGDDIEIDETFPIDPKSVYAKTKLQSEILIHDYFKEISGEAIIYRLFNHSHSSQKGPFFFPELLEQLTNPEVIEVKLGNLDLYRDFSPVKNLIEILYRSSLFPYKEGVEVFNVCSGQPRLLRNLTRKLTDRLNPKVKITQDNAKVRKNEPKKLIGSRKKLDRFLKSAPPLTDDQFIDLFFAPID